MTKIRWALLLAPAVLMAACSGGGSHHAVTAPSTTRSSASKVSTRVISPTVAPTTSASPSPPAISKTTPPSPGRTTQIVRVSPVDAAGKLKPGYTVTATYPGTNCSAGSDTGANAYRCFAGNTVYDPCWLDTDDATNHTVVCLLQPWSTKVTRITVPQIDGGFGSPVTQAPLGVQLSDGEHCIALQGARSDFNGRVIDFSCDHALVLRPLHTQGQVWLADTATGALATGVTHTAGPTMPVTTAWVAAPSLSAPSSQ
jgi:hypothetical protein